MAKERQTVPAEISGAFTPQELAQILEDLNTIHLTEEAKDHISQLGNMHLIPRQNETVFKFLDGVYTTIIKNTKHELRRVEARAIRQSIRRLDKFSFRFGMYPAMQAIADALELNYKNELGVERRTLTKSCCAFRSTSRAKFLTGIKNAITILIIQNVNPSIVINTIKQGKDKIFSPKHRTHLNSLLRIYKIAADASIVMHEVPSWREFIDKDQIDDHEGLLLGYDKFYEELRSKVLSADLAEIKRRYADVLKDGRISPQDLLEQPKYGYFPHCPKLELHELTTKKTVNLLRLVDYDAEDLEARIDNEFLLRFYPPAIGPEDTFGKYVSQALDAIQMHILRYYLFFTFATIDKIAKTLAAATDIRARK